MIKIILSILLFILQVINLTLAFYTPLNNISQIIALWSIILIFIIMVCIIWEYIE